MINPDSELRLSQALTIAGETAEQSARKLKMAKDLSKGFRAVSLIPGAIGLNTVHAVTRFEDNLFRVSAELYQEKEWEGIQEDRDVYEALISRITIDDPIDDPLDKGYWKLENESGYLTQAFRSTRGELTEEEFWRRYMASEFDSQRTLEWSFAVMADRRRLGNSIHTLTWLTMEPRRIETE